MTVLVWEPMGRSLQAEHRGGRVVVSHCKASGWSVAFELCGRNVRGFASLIEAQTEAEEYLRTNCPPGIEEWAYGDPTAEIPF